MHVASIFLLLFLKIIYLFIYLFLDTGEVREEERKRNVNVWLPLMCPLLGTLACNPGMCPDWELDQQPFGSQAGTQSAEPHQPGLRSYFLLRYLNSDI